MSAPKLLRFLPRSRRLKCSRKNALLKRLKSFYTDEPLKVKLQGIFGEKNGDQASLTSERLRCLLLVVTRNLTTDSPWPISSNPFFGI